MKECIPVLLLISLCLNLGCKPFERENNNDSENIKRVIDKGGCFSEEGFIVFYEFEVKKYVAIYSNQLRFGSNVYDQFNEGEKRLSVDIDDFSKNELIQLPYCTDIVNLDGFESYSIKEGEVRVEMKQISDSTISFAAKLTNCKFINKNSKSEFVTSETIKPFIVHYQIRGG